MLIKVNYIILLFEGSDTPTSASKINQPIKIISANKRAITIYQCQAEHKSELSFDADVILTNIKQSKESGWYEATLPDGKSGLVPANYIKFIDE
jgi:hypothetical protein